MNCVIARERSDRGNLDGRQGSAERGRHNSLREVRDDKKDESVSEIIFRRKMISDTWRSLFRYQRKFLLK